MTYSKANRMATATVSGTTSTYTYDAFGNRQEVKTGASPTQIMQYDQDGNLLTETSTSGTETDYAYMDGMPVAAIQPGAATISALLTDHLGTVAARPPTPAKPSSGPATTNPSAQCSPTASSAHDPAVPRQLPSNSTSYYYNIFSDRDPISATGGRPVSCRRIFSRSRRKIQIRMLAYGNNPFQVYGSVWDWSVGDVFLHPRRDAQNLDNMQASAEGQTLERFKWINIFLLDPEMLTAYSNKYFMNQL